MNVAKSTVGVGVKVLESGEKLIKKQFHRDNSPVSSPKLSTGTLRSRDDVNPNGVPQEETKAECICTYKKDLGKLIITEKYLKFRSLHFDELIHFEKISSIRKKGQQKVVVKLKDDSNCSFGPFDDIRRGVIHDILRTIFESYEKKKEEKGGSGININAIPGLNDQIVKDIFESKNPLPEIVAGTFKEPSAEDTPCIDEVFDIPLKNLFALVFTDSATFLTDLQTKQNDTGMQFTKWEFSEAQACYTRQFDFIKKNKLATATVHQTQLCRLKSATELLFETSNKMENVPFSDSFTVDTKWRVIQEGDKTRMKVWVRVDFKKPVSFIKGRIESGSISSTQDYFKEYAAFLKSTLSSGGDGSADVTEKGIMVGGDASKKSSSMWFYLIIFLSVSAFLFGCYFIWGFLFVNTAPPPPVMISEEPRTLQTIEETLLMIERQLQLISEKQFIVASDDDANADSLISTLVALQYSLQLQLQSTSTLLSKITHFLELAAQSKSRPL